MTPNLGNSTGPVVQQVQDQQQNIINKASSAQKSGTSSIVERSDQRLSGTTQFTQSSSPTINYAYLTQLPVEFINKMKKFLQLAQSHRDTEGQESLTESAEPGLRQKVFGLLSKFKGPQ